MASKSGNVASKSGNKALKSGSVASKSGNVEEHKENAMTGDHAKCYWVLLVICTYYVHITILLSYII